MVGIIILNYNTYSETLNCIKSIEEKVCCEYKIYLVDNGSEAKCGEDLKSFFCDDPKVEIILTGVNLGYSCGNNVGIRKAIEDGAAQILITNSDVIFLNDAVSIMCQDLAGKVALVGPKVITAQGENGQYLWKPYSFKYAIVSKKPFHLLAGLFRGLQRCYDVRQFTEKFEFEGSLSGCCFLMDSAVFKAIDFFDENVFLYSEEAIMGIKLTKMGKLACYEPKAEVRHLAGASGRNWAFINFHTYASDYYLFTRYCKNNALTRGIIKVLRLTAYYINAIFVSDFRKHAKRLWQKLNEIDNENYKITK